MSGLPALVMKWKEVRAFLPETRFHMKCWTGLDRFEAIRLRKAFLKSENALA